MNLFDILEELEDTSSKNEKIKIIKENKGNEEFKEILKMAYDTIGINYYVKKVPTVNIKGKQSLVDPKGMLILRSLLKDLSERNVTGHDSLRLIEKTLARFDGESQIVIDRVIKRDLKGGYSESTINKAIKGLIPVFNVALAKVYKDHSEKVKDDTYVILQKINGARCIVIKLNGEIKFYSRTGKEFFTLDVIKEKIEEQTKGIDNVVFDGEICKIKPNGEDDYSGLKKELLKKNYTMKEPRYKMFDYLTVENFYNCNDDVIYSERMDSVGNLITNNKFLIVLEYIRYNKKNYDKLWKMKQKNNWEGLIFRADKKYKNKRTDELLKHKSFLDAEYKVVGTLNAVCAYTVKGKGQAEEMMLKSVEILHKGHITRVGSGWSLEQKREFYKFPERIIGSWICVNYFTETTNKKGTISLEFPTLGHIIGKKKRTT